MRKAVLAIACILPLAACTTTERNTAIGAGAGAAVGGVATNSVAGAAVGGVAGGALGAMSAR